MDLRAKIADAVYDHPRADDIINAVMGVIEGEIKRQRATLPPAVSIDTYEQSHDEIAAALELAANDRAPVTITTCSNTITTYLPVAVAGQVRALEGGK